MAFYSDFAGHYEKIFPFRQGTFAFLDRWLPKEGRVLDVGCGTGLYCRELARTGRDCLGIDLDPGMIAEAEEHHPQGAFRILGMTEVGLLPAGRFAAIYCIGNVLPHLPAGRLAAFLMDIRQLLAPGGVWIFQTVNFDPILGQQEYAFPERHLPEDDLTFLRWYEDIRVDRLCFHTTLLRAGAEVFDGEVVLYPRTSVDYLLAHRNSGFAKVAHFADFGGRGFSPQEYSGSVFVFRREAGD